MVGFDPLRTDERRNSIDLLRRRVESGRAIGVKLYPPMGFKPIGNSADVDRRLHALYTWCCEQDVPIVAHCSPANAVRGAKKDAFPTGWTDVLKEHDNLRLDLAHVGGIAKKGWVHEAIGMIDAFYPRVFADVSNHDHSHHRVTKFLSDVHGEVQLTTNPDNARRQIAFGTDYWFVYMHDKPKEFLHRYVEAFATTFGESSVPRFASGAAQEFLGLTDRTRRNRGRIVDRLRRMQFEPRGRFRVRDSLRRVLALTQAEVDDIEAPPA
jgi:hypothetical protein